MEPSKTTTGDDTAMASPAGAAPPPSGSSNGHDPRWLQRAHGRWAWQIRADWACLLEAADAPDWTHLDAEPRAQLVKTNDGRQVWRVQYGPHLLFVKVARPGRQWAFLRRLLFGTDAVRERRVAEYAAARGIDTVTPVAVASAPFHGREPVSILITLGLPHAVALNEFWESLDSQTPPNRQVRNQVIDAAARLIAQAHHHGCEHTDLHAGNMLIEANGQATCRALFVDLLNIRTGKPLTDQAVVHNLAQFNQWFRQHAPLTDRIRFLYDYLAWRERLQGQEPLPPRLNHDRRAMLADLDRAVVEHANALYGKRDRRALRTGRYFARLKFLGGWRAHVFLEAKHHVAGSPASEIRLTADQWKAWLRHPEEWARGDRRQYVIKESSTNLVYRTRLDLAPDWSLDVVCKRWVPRGFSKRLAMLVQPSRPMVTWCMANALLHRQLPTARPLAVVEKRRCGQLLDSFIITEHIEHAHDLDALLTIQLREMEAAAARRLKRELSESLVAALRRLHERGFTHRDFKAPNVLVQWQPGLEAPPRIVLVDLDGIRQVRRPNPSAEIRALARLSVSLERCRHVSHADRLRFLRRYLARPGRPEPDWRPIWQQVEEASIPIRALLER